MALVYSSLQTITTTNLQTLASSATAGWQSGAIDNTTDLYLEAHCMGVFDFANTAPANHKCGYIYAYGGIESGVYTNPASGTEGSITLPNIESNALALVKVATIPYTTQDETVEVDFAIALAHGGILRPFWGLVVVNYSGAAFTSAILEWKGLKVA